MIHRNGEEGTMPSRNSRFFQDSGYWYYSTREGMNIGPFDTRHEAQAGASAFIDFILHAEPQVVAFLASYRSAA